MKVEKLPAEVRSKLQSGVVVTDAVQCVLELVHNSLDARATGIAVRVDLKTYMICVIDNGKGIDKNDLELVGERFMTSKYHSYVEIETSFPMYGFRGQALSSLLDVSRSLTIETKVNDEGPTFVKVFQNTRAEPIKTIKSVRSGTGTTITIEDFMYLMPVRRKRISEVFDMEEIKSQLQYLALIHCNVCFTLRNENKGLILLQTPQASNVLELISNIFGKTIARSLKPVHYEEEKYEVTGFISLKPQSQSNIQLIYINKRIISKGVIHKFINSIIKEYSVKKNLFGDSPTGELLKQLKASHNVFIIQIQCPHCYYELFTNERKVTVEFRNWKESLKFVHKAIKKTFKYALNLNSSNSQECDKKTKAEDKKEEKGTFGTSLLVNAVRGAPAKRAFKNQSGRIKKRVKVPENKEPSIALLSNINKTANNEQLITNLSTSAPQNEYTNDTFESPIPKKCLRGIKQKDDTHFKQLSFNQSFIEFYEWLKTRFDTDVNAHNLYSDFLEFKNRRVGSSEIPQFKSPILGVKQKKRIQGIKKKNMEEKQKTPANALSLLDEEIAIVTQKQLKIFPNQHLRLKKAVQFTSKMNVTPKNLNLDCSQNESIYLERHRSQVFKKPESRAIFSKHKRQVECNHTLVSLPSSEVQFTNIIKFRNMSESFFHQTSDVPKTEYHGTEKTLSTMNTWVSHYENLSINAELRGKVYNTKTFQFWPGPKGTHRRNVNLENFERSLVEFSNSRQNSVVQNVEIQVNMQFSPPEKVNAIVQTFQEIPESPVLENSYVFNVSNEERGVINVEKHLKRRTGQQSSQVLENTIQEVPNPDFWNTSEHMQFEVQNENLFVPNENEIIFNKSTDDIKKASTSNEFICGHKSQSSSKVESISKETQTLAVIWTDSLIEMGCLRKSYEASATEENTQQSQPTTISKTIPIEEIECNHAQEMVAEFCVTERHDFVPKGLSPRFFESKTPKVSSLSSSEKCKIKSTIENAQNEFLNKIKWQNEMTGDCIKPAIPDGIIYEIRRKAGGNLTNYENPVLSATLSYCAVKVHNLLHSFAFTKDLLMGVEVLGQLDKKFIVTKMNISSPKKMELISLFDQHAVDERIRLEEIINENVSPDGKFISSRPHSTIECRLTESDVRVISDFKEKFLKYGLEAEPINEDTVSVNEIPTFLLKKHKDDLKSKKESLSDAVRALILNIIGELTETRGAISGIPKIMHNAFCLEACHKAIKFNKALSVESMTEMIRNLQKCKLPFQCAHGRPSVIPIIDLEDFKPTMEETEAVNLQKVKKFHDERKDAESSETTELKK